MKRYIPFIGMIVFIAAVLWAGVYIQQERQQQLAAREMYEKERHLVVYSDMPGQVNQDLAAAFYKDTGLRAYIMTMTEDELQRAIRNPKENQLPDAVIASEDTLYAGRLQGAFIPYTSYVTDEVPHELKDAAGAWIGLWYDPLVFVINRDYYNMGGSNINTWSDLLTDANMVISFPDLAATDIAGSFLCEYVELHGQERAELYFRSLQTRIGAYSKTMAPVMHRVAGGEAQAGVVDAVTARQYRFDGAPVFVVYPQDGTAYWLIGAAATRWCSDEEETGKFIDWLLSLEAADVLRKNRMQFNFANSAIAVQADSKQQGPVFFKTVKRYNDKDRRAMQDWWIRTIRFGRDG